MARDAEVCVIRRDDNGGTGALAALIHKSIVAWGSDIARGLAHLPIREGGEALIGIEADLAGH